MNKSFFMIPVIVVTLCAGASVSDANIYIRGTITHCDESEQCLFEYFSMNIFPDSTFSLFIETDSSNYDQSDAPAQYSKLMMILISPDESRKYSNDSTMFTLRIPGSKDTVYLDSDGIIKSLSFYSESLHYEVFPDSLSFPSLL